MEFSTMVLTGDYHWPATKIAYVSSFPQASIQRPNSSLESSLLSELTCASANPYPALPTDLLPWLNLRGTSDPLIAVQNETSERPLCWNRKVSGGTPDSIPRRRLWVRLYWRFLTPSGSGTGVRVPLIDGDGFGHLLLVQPHVKGARTLQKAGRRHIRLRELAADVLVLLITLLRWLFKIMYSSLFPNGSLKLYGFIAMVTVIMIVLSQLPTFHSLKYINLVSLLLSLGYTFLVVGACIHAGTSKNAPPRDYSLENSQSSRVFSAFTSISIIAAIYGNGILPEIQATLAPPVAGKMSKGLLMCYSVIFITFYATAVSGYWVFGNKSGSNILKSLLPDEGPSLAPTWILGLGIIFVLLQLFAIGLVYSQVSFEIMEKKSADTKQGMFSKRNLIPGLILRTMYMIFCGFFAAMLPFFGDMSGVVGVVGFILLDFILPMLLSNITFQKRRSSFTYWINVFIMVVFSGVGLVGSFSTIRKLVLDANKFKLFQ